VIYVQANFVPRPLSALVQLNELQTSALKCGSVLQIIQLLYLPFSQSPEENEQSIVLALLVKKENHFQLASQFQSNFLFSHLQSSAE